MDNEHLNFTFYQQIDSLPHCNLLSNDIFGENFKSNNEFLLRKPFEANNNFASQKY